MNRTEWLKRLRREAEEKYDTLWSPLYGDTLGLYPNETHQQFIRKFLDLLPQPAEVLDAACGAGRYIPMLLENGHSVTGVDQSQGMLDRSRARFPGVRFVKTGLQEMDFPGRFDGVIRMDAMEHVCPEDWLPVLMNFQRALKPGGTLYFTVEIGDEQEIDDAYKRGKAQGLPILHGEMAEIDVYHFYPSIGQVREWLERANLALTGEGQGNEYRHFLSTQKL